jgi:hypothetical protein
MVPEAEVDTGENADSSLFFAKDGISSLGGGMSRKIVPYLASSAAASTAEATEFSAVLTGVGKLSVFTGTGATDISVVLFIDGGDADFSGSGIFSTFFIRSLNLGSTTGGWLWGADSGISIGCAGIISGLGISSKTPHLAQFTILPECSSSDLNFCPQFAQKYLMNIINLRSRARIIAGHRLFFQNTTPEHFSGNGNRNRFNDYYDTPPVIKFKSEINVITARLPKFKSTSFI